MPYKMGKNDKGESCIYKEGSGALVKGSCHTDPAMTEKMFKAMNAAMTTENKAAPKFAVDANDNHPDKLPLGDKKQIEGAITSVVTGSFRGNEITPPLTDAEKKTARGRIKAAISASGEPDEWKQNELARLGGKELQIFQKDMMGMMPMMKIEPDDPRAMYDPLGGTGTQACANCQWFCASEAQCALIWDDVVATGKCNLWLGEPTEAEELAAQDPIPVVIVDQPATGAAELPTVENKESPIISWLKKTFGKKADEQLTGSGFKALPGNKWVAYHSNSFEDRVGELFTEAAHDQYIGWLDKGVIPYPDLWYWHIPGTKHGQAEWVDRIGHIVVSAGSFDDTPIAQLFRKEYEKNPQMTSHTYGYPKSALLDDGSFQTYFTVEISPLPVGKQASLWSPFMEVKEMPITPEKITKLEGILGKDLASQVLGNADKMSKELEALGIKFKEAEGLPSVDNDAREAIKELATANKSVNDATTKQLTDILTAVKALSDGEKARNEAITKLETFVKEQFELAPRASQSKATVVDPTKDKEAAFLAAKAADPLTQLASKSIGEQIAGMVLKPKGE